MTHELMDDDTLCELATAAASSSYPLAAALTYRFVPAAALPGWAVGCAVDEDGHNLRGGWTFFVSRLAELITAGSAPDQLNAVTAAIVQLGPHATAGEVRSEVSRRLASGS